MHKLSKPSGNEALEASLLASSAGNLRLNSDRSCDSLMLLLLSSLSWYVTCWLRRRFTRSVSDVAYSPYTSCICAIVTWSSYSISESSSCRARFKPTVYRNSIISNSYPEVQRDVVLESLSLGFEIPQDSIFSPGLRVRSFGCGPFMS